MFSPAGFGPVLAQAVGTPSITVYGGRESFRTTQRGGAHLAPTLGIDPIKPCDCHSHRHACRKFIDERKAFKDIEAFVNEVVIPPKAKPRVLIVGTTYVDSDDRVKLTEHWAKLQDHAQSGLRFPASRHGFAKVAGAFQKR